MIAPQQFGCFPVFGCSATKCEPNPVKYGTGYIPGDVLPAEHLNWFLANDTQGYNLLCAGVSSIEQELATILSCAGCTPDPTSCSQVYNAVMYQINACITACTAPKDHASSATTYGVGNADCYGHLKISDEFSCVLSACSGVAASQYALATAYACLANCGAQLGDTAGCALGFEGAAGTCGTAARSDHVHPYPDRLGNVSEGQYVRIGSAVGNRFYLSGDYIAPGSSVIQSKCVAVAFAYNAQSAIQAERAGYCRCDACVFLCLHNAVGCSCCSNAVGCAYIRNNNSVPVIITMPVPPFMICYKVVDACCSFNSYYKIEGPVPYSLVQVEANSSINIKYLIPFSCCSRKCCQNLYYRELGYI